MPAADQAGINNSVRQYKPSAAVKRQDGHICLRLVARRNRKLPLLVTVGGQAVKAFNEPSHAIFSTTG
jgi:hypothetical protein